MKKVNFKKALTALMVAFTFFVVGTGTVNAQMASADQGLYSPAQGAFVNSDQAGVTLTASVGDMQAVLGTLQPGSPLYTSTLRQAIYYRGIYLDIQGGQDVATSIGTGLRHLTMTPNASNGSIPRTTLLALRQGAISLLSN
jgi:hypothetical protein